MKTINLYFRDYNGIDGCGIAPTAHLTFESADLIECNVIEVSCEFDDHFTVSLSACDEYQLYENGNHIQLFCNTRHDGQLSSISGVRPNGDIFKIKTT